MSNGFRTGSGKMTNGNRLIGRSLISEHNQFLQEQLIDAQQSLFFARSVKEAKFLQNRIDYLQQLLKPSKVTRNGRRIISGHSRRG